MRIILELEGVGNIGVIKDNYIVFDRFGGEQVLKSGRVVRKMVNPRYLPSLGAALEELRCHVLGKKLAKSKCSAKSITELLNRVNKINFEWEDFCKEHKLVVDRDKR